MRRARRNPAPSPRLPALYATLRAAVEKGAQDVLERGDGSAKCFQPMPMDAKLGSVESEMDLVRYCVGAWPRTDKPYEAAAPTPVDFLAFAYAAERACRAGGEPEAAEVWRFIRSVPKTAAKTQNGYLQKGGVSRVLLSARTLGIGPAHCTAVTLAMESPLDTLRFARMDLWPVERGSGGGDGWPSVDKARRRSLNAAWRGTSVDWKGVYGGLLGAGQKLSDAIRGVQVGTTHVNLDGIILTGAVLRSSLFYECIFANADLRKISAIASSMINCDLRNADLRGADMRGVNLTGADLAGAKLEGANFDRASRSESDPLIEGWDFFPATRRLVRSIR